MVNEAASVVVQERVGAPPLLTLVGFAEITQVGALVEVFSFTVTEQVPVPPGPVTVPLKIVSAVIAMVGPEPDIEGNVYGPHTAVLIVNEVALVDDQVMVDCSPLFTLAGLADREQVGRDPPVEHWPVIGRHKVSVGVQVQVPAVAL